MYMYIFVMRHITFTLRIIPGLCLLPISRGLCFQTCVTSPLVPILPEVTPKEL